MSVPLKFIRYQGPVLRGMGEAAVGALKQRVAARTATARRAAGRCRGRCIT